MVRMIRVARDPAMAGMATPPNPFFLDRQPLRWSHSGACRGDFGLPAPKMISRSIWDNVFR
jgi:hypothetical protein